MSGDKDLDDHIPMDEDLMAEEGEYTEESFGDEDFSDEDWDSYDEEYAEDSDAETDEGETPAKTKKAGSSFNKILIGIGIAAVLGIGATVFMGGGAKVPVPAPVAPQQVTAPAAPQRPKLNSASLQGSGPATQRDVVYGLGRNDERMASQGESGAGLLNNPEQVNDIQKYRESIEGELAAQDELANSDTPLAVDEREPPMPTPMTAAAPSESVLTPLPADNAPITTAVNPFDDAASAAAVPDAITGTPVSPTIGNAGEANTRTLADESSIGLPRARDLRMAENQKAESLDINPVPPSAMTDIVEPTTVSPVDAALAQKLDEISRRLDAMEGQLDSLQQGGGDADLAQKVTSLQKTVTQLETALESGARTEQPSRPVKVSAPKAAKSVARKASTSRATMVARTSWTLKSAQPGRAMVAQGSNGEVRSITVGDSLSGIGRITQIYQASNGWVVEGTTGRITQ